MQALGVQMPTFCRHNRMIQNCPICSREQQIELRPIVSSSAPRSSLPRTGAPSTSSTRSRSTGPRVASSRTGGGVRVRRLERGVDDGYRSRLVAGLKSSSDAERLAEELAFAVTRLARLEHDPPGLYAEVAAGQGDIEERTWLAFLIAYLGPLDNDDDPFRSIAAARTTWASAEPPALDAIELGPRTAHEPERGTRTTDAYRAWAERAGSQHAAFAGEGAWTPERRFERVFERMALPGLHRDARYDLLVTLGRLGVYDLRAAALKLGGDNEVTVAAKRILGIGDPLLLERRATELADACSVPLEALDLGFYNWGRGTRATLGLDGDAEPDPDVLGSAQHALGI
jgi:hypothetical protein